MSKIQQVLSPKQIQELSLRPKMLQSLQILALPQMELEMQIKKELELNPILELLEEDESNEQLDTEKTEETTASDSEKEEKTNDDDLLSEDLKEMKELSDILDSWNDYHKDYRDQSDQDERSIFDTYNSDRYDSFVKDNRDGFFDQIEELSLTNNEIDFAKELLESTDEFGYLEPDIDIYQLGYEYFKKGNEVAESIKKIDARVDEIHKMVMGLNPKGVTARSVPECLIAQISTEDDDYELLVILLNDSFDDLIHRRYQKIATKLSIATSKVLQLKDKVARLNPKPGLLLLANRNDYIIPDVLIKKIDDEFVVIVNDYNIPRLTISSRYRAMLMGGKGSDRQTLSFIRDKINSAKFVIKSIYMRNRTIKRVTWSIIKNQKDFFYNNTGILEPLTYQVIASDLNVSESTVSRVVRNKYADTPFGLYCLKDFFTSTAGRTDDYEDVSRQNVQKHISRLISEEDKTNPISDLEITAALREININVSRRVIAKYRDSMGILNSRLRRIQE